MVTWSVFRGVHAIVVKIVDVHGILLKVIDFKLLDPHPYGFESRQRLWILSCEEVIKLA
jgi:hypothetical protein